MHVKFDVKIEITALFPLKSSCDVNIWFTKMQKFNQFLIELYIKQFSF